MPPTKEPPLRLAPLRAVWLAGTLLLVARLAFLQLYLGPELHARAQRNTFVDREIAADRGVVYDRDGRQLVVNVPRFEVSIIPAALPIGANLDAVLDRISALVDVPRRQESGHGQAATVLPDRQVEEESSAAGPTSDPAPSDDTLPTNPAKRRDQEGDRATSTGSDLATVPAFDVPTLEDLLYDKPGHLYRTWQPVTLARDLPREDAFAVMEAQAELPFLNVSVSSVRSYPFGATVGHLLGYMGSIPKSELTDYRDQGYRLDEIVGRNGLEYTYERALRGRKGSYRVEVNAMGQEQGRVGEPIPAEAGLDLRLALDMDLQRVSEEVLAQTLKKLGGKHGVVVAVDPRNGAIRALVSIPSYDNNLLAAGRVKLSSFQALMQNPDLPLLNRAISGVYPPGSTYKQITAAAGLETGVISTRSQISCPGIIQYANQYNPAITYPFVCHQRSGHGSETVRRAIADSCDIFFYEVAGGNATGRPTVEGLGSDRLAYFSHLFGLGDLTGIELLGESRGLVPTADWLKEVKDETWTTGKTYITGIGQGDLRVTPLQLANVTAAVANGGTLYRLHLVDALQDGANRAVPWPVELGDQGPGIIRELGIQPAYLAEIRAGMRDAVTRGTAQVAWTHLPTRVAVAAKTGTAEFCEGYQKADGSADCRRDRYGNLLTHAWFTAFAPYEAPEIVVTVLVEGVGLGEVIQGSQVAGPVAAEILKAYFGLPRGLPTPTPCAGCPTATPDGETLPGAVDVSPPAPNNATLPGRSEGSALEANPSAPPTADPRIKILPGYKP